VEYAKRPENVVVIGRNLKRDPGWQIKPAFFHPSGGDARFGYFPAHWQAFDVRVPVG
jgi:hypothetical protein